jgi:tetratricopeptide (TPR) repeat protein
VVEKMEEERKELQFFKTSTLVLIGVSILGLVVVYLKREFFKRIYLRHKRYEEIKKCKEFINKSEDKEEKAALQYKIARIYHASLGDYSQAIVEYKNFIGDYPDSFLMENVLYYMGRCWEFLGNFSRAMVEYEKLIKQFPNGARSSDAKLRMEDIEAVVEG